MAIYEYACTACGKSHEESLGMKAYIQRGALVDCPHCGKPSLERIIGTPAVINDGNPRTLGSLGEKNLKKLDSRQREIYEAKERQARGPDVQQLVRDVLTGKRK